MLVIIIHGFRTEHPDIVLQIIEPVSFQHQLLQGASALETSSTPVAGSHPDFQILAYVTDGIRGILVFMAHGDGFFRTNISASAAIRTSSANVFNDPNFLAGIQNQNFARRAVVCTAGTSDAFVRIPDRTPPETLRDWERVGWIRKSHLPCLEANDRFLDFAQQRHPSLLLVAHYGKHQGNQCNYEKDHVITHDLINPVSGMRGRNQGHNQDQYKDFSKENKEIQGIKAHLSPREENSDEQSAIDEKPPHPRHLEKSKLGT
jgi:hypothetical protein